MHDLPWHGRVQFNAAKRDLWRLQLPEEQGEATAARPGSRAAEGQALPLSPSQLRPQQCCACMSYGYNAGNSVAWQEDAAVGVDERAGKKPRGQVVGYWREHSTLTHVVIRNAGHMVRALLHLA